MYCFNLMKRYLLGKCWAEISGLVKAEERHCSFIPAATVTMYEQEVPVSVAQRLLNRFLAQEGVKSAKIQRRLTKSVKEETLLRVQLFP